MIGCDIIVVELIYLYLLLHLFIGNLDFWGLYTGMTKIDTQEWQITLCTLTLSSPFYQLPLCNSLNKQCCCKAWFFFFLINIQSQRPMCRCYQIHSNPTNITICLPDLDSVKLRHIFTSFIGKKRNSAFSWSRLLEKGGKAFLFS